MNPRLFLPILLVTVGSLAQDAVVPKAYTLEASAFYGSIILHNPDISHLITDHPYGLILAYSRKTFGEEAWEQGFNFPDIGTSFVYQDMGNKTLGKNYGLYAHYNFYFLKRHAQLRIGQGVAYTTNPYDRDNNFRNNAYGSRLLSSTYLMLNVHRENLYRGLGLKAGISLVHYSNANMRAPNTSTNTLAFNLGLTYTLNDSEQEYLISEKQRITEPIRYNLTFRTGINESDIIGSGQYPFYIISANADKRLGNKSAVQVGADIFFSNFLKELIRYQSIAFPENEVAVDTDYKRVGVFVGHELFINKISITAQLGYYIYYPFDFEGKVYNRIGLKRYFGEKWFGEISLKSHAAAAEALEFGIGIRL